MHLLSLWILLVSLTSRVLADISILEPTAGRIFSQSDDTVSVTVSWDDDSTNDDAPLSLSKIAKYAIKLCTGPNDDIIPVKLYTEDLPASKTSFTVQLDPKEIPNGIYFIQVYGFFISKGYTIHYTPRFTVTGMSASVSTYLFSASLFSVTGAQPQQQVAATSPETIDSRSFTVPYTEQTGSVRYAPMQTQPGPSISYSTYSLRHAKSIYTPYSSIRPSPNVYSTITPGWSYSVTSKANTASVAPYPTYFYPASQRVISASISSAHKKRWI